MTTKLIKDAVTDVKREAWELTNESDWVAKTTLTAIRYTMIPMTDAMTRNTYMKGKDFMLQDNYVNSADIKLKALDQRSSIGLCWQRLPWLWCGAQWYPRTDTMTRNTYVKGKDFKLKDK